MSDDPVKPTEIDAFTNATWGPVRQGASLTGFVIAIGGIDDRLSVHLQDGPHVYRCAAEREMAIRLRSYLLEDRRVRVSGHGTWSWDPESSWQMREFAVESFQELDVAPLRDVVRDLRALQSGRLEHVSAAC